MFNKKSIQLISLGCSLIVAFNMPITSTAADGARNRYGILSAGIESVFSPKKTSDVVKTAAPAQGSVNPVIETVSTFSGVYNSLLPVQNDYEIGRASCRERV